MPTTTPLTTTDGWSKQRRPSRNAIKGLIEFGAPLVGITEADLKTAGGRDPYPITDEGFLHALVVHWVFAPVSGRPRWPLVIDDAA